MKKDDFAFAFGRGDLIVLRARQSFGQFGQLVIVRSEQRLGRVLRRIVQVLGHGPGDRKTIEGRRAAANLIQQDQRARRRAVQDRRRLSHLDHERRAAARQIVRRSHARPDAIQQRQAARVQRARSRPSAPGCK